MHIKIGTISISMALLAASLTFSGAAIGQNLTASPLPFIQTTNLTSQPVGHYDFCKRYPKSCGVNHGSLKPIQLTKQNWARLLQVNAAINEKVHPVTDWELFQKEEYWEYPNKMGNSWYGDCEDYVLMKQKALEKFGFSPANLLIAVVRKPNGEAHAVLTVRTTSGDFILDNLRSEVLNWQDTEYQYLKRQSVKNAGSWVNIKTQPKGLLLAQNNHKQGQPNKVGSVSATKSIR